MKKARNLLRKRRYYLIARSHPLQDSYGVAVIRNKVSVTCRVDRQVIAISDCLCHLDDLIAGGHPLKHFRGIAKPINISRTIDLDPAHGIGAGRRERRQGKRRGNIV